jgi:hypothetical protein
MNKKLNFIPAAFLVMVVSFLAGCKGNTPASETTGADQVSTDTMDHNMPKGNGKTYVMKMESNPDIIVAGKQVVFSLKPQVEGRESEPVPLDTRGGFEIHLVLVSDDLSWFDHRHPVLSDLGTYELKYTFEEGGIYDLYADYQPTGSTETYEKKSFAVNGNSTLGKAFKEPKLSSAAGPYQVSISPGESDSFASGRAQDLNITITKDNIPVNPSALGDYLGSKGHMVIINLNDRNFLHVHPSVENGNLVFHTTFPKPGLYRAWFQFQTENIVQTADFVLQAIDGDTKSGE